MKITEQEMKQKIKEISVFLTIDENSEKILSVNIFQNIEISTNSSDF